MKIFLLRFISLGILILPLNACAVQPTDAPAGDVQPTALLSDEVEISFAPEQPHIQPGECTTLIWEVTGGYWVKLDDIEVPEVGEKEVCPLETREYILMVDLGDSVATRSIEVIVGSVADQADGPRPPELLAEITPGTPAYQAGAWTATGGPPGGLGYDIRMDPRDPEVMYVTDAYTGVFKSLDGGMSWFPINNGITARAGFSGDTIPVFCLTIDPNAPGTIWVGTQFGGGVFRSDDGGLNWYSLSNGILERGLAIRGFSVEPGNSDVVYLAGEISSWEWNNGVSLPGLGLDMVKGAVYKTTDGGQNWKRIWYGDNLARYIWIHPTDHDLLYVSTGIFDREPANSNPDTLDPGGVGILRSRDGGASWEVLGVDHGFLPNELSFGSLFMHPRNPDILLAAAGSDSYLWKLGSPLGAIYLTENGGDSWQRVLGLDNASTVEICESDPDVMYAGSINGIHRSMDGGHNWMEVGGFLWGSPDTVAGFPIDMQCDPRDPMRIFINNYIGGNFLSTDGGFTWQTTSQGYTGALMSQINIAWDNPAHVYSTSRMGVFASLDGGDHWLGTAYPPARAPEGIVISVDPFDASHIQAVFWDAGPEPRVSWNGGLSWKIVNTGLWGPGKWKTNSFTQIVFSPYDPYLAFASVGNNDCSLNLKDCESAVGYGILRSTDRGETWLQSSLTDANITDLKIVDESVIYAAAYPFTVYRSTDRGQTWETLAQDVSPMMTDQINSEGEYITRPTILSMAVDPFDHDRVYAGFFNGGLMISTDGGLTWKVSGAGLIPETSIIDIEPDPVHPGVLYLGSTNSGIYYSSDHGETWNQLNHLLGTRSIADLALSADGSVLYAATTGGGVFRLGDPPE